MTPEKKYQYLIPMFIRYDGMILQAHIGSGGEQLYLFS